MNAPYILLVDDDTALLQALPHMVSLRLHGVKVDTADSAIEALELIRSHDYDAIVSDIKMPGIDGLELLTRIKCLRPQTPTLLITGHLDQNLLIEAMKKGAYDFIQKPIDRIHFVAALHRAVQTRQLTHQVEEQQQLLGSYARVLKQMGTFESDDAHMQANLTSRELTLSGKPSSPFQPPLWLVS